MPPGNSIRKRKEENECTVRIYAQAWFSRRIVLNTNHFIYHFNEILYRPRYTAIPKAFCPLETGDQRRRSMFSWSCRGARYHGGWAAPAPSLKVRGHAALGGERRGSCGKKRNLKRGEREKIGGSKEGRGTKEKEREGEEMKMVKGDRKEENRASKRERPFHFLHMQYSSAP